jgi:hypothetical protein
MFSKKYANLIIKIDIGMLFTMHAYNYRILIIWPFMIFFNNCLKILQFFSVDSSINFVFFDEIVF